MSRSLRIIAPIALVAGLAGCGGGARDDLPRQAVSGTVTLGGQPLADGVITFDPVDLSAGQPATGTIADGSYRIPRDAGPTPGSYVVRITEAQAGTGMSAAEAMESGAGYDTAPVRGGIPAKFNSQSELRADVTDDGPNTFDFDLAAS